MNEQTENAVRVTLGKAASAEYVEKKSVFIASVSPVDSEEEAMEFVRAVKKKYSDAKHNVFAYQIGGGRISRYSDDGEPQGTAGIPVLEIINKGGFTDAVIVVTRYFGGILLGAGGLVRAYSTAAKMGVDAAGIVTYREYTEFTVNCSYSDYGKLTNVLSNEMLITDSVNYDDNVTAAFAIQCEQFESMKSKITEVTAGRAVITEHGKRFDRK